MANSDKESDVADFDNAHLINLSRRWKVARVNGEAHQQRWIDLSDGLPAESSLELNRRFHCPNNLARGTRVFLALKDFPARMDMQLNAFEITPTVDGPVWEAKLLVDVSGLLQRHNELRLLVRTDQANVEPKVSLVITESDSPSANAQ